ncbi:hypothetical protein BGW41_007956 [Actinomortierella wolfii]|nr:hypothetical protein BGW41_007956 [Actinomortierella wolfii]
MKSIIITTLLTTSCTFTTLAEVSKIVRVDKDSLQFIDALGRSRFFHGINMVKKSYPWHLDVDTFDPGQSIVDKDIKVLKELNVNSIRLGVHWAGVEPWVVKPEWNPPNSRFPVPLKWDPFKVDANGVPSEADCATVDWSASYLSNAVGKAFGQLYSNHDNLGDSWVNYWKVMAENFKDFIGVQGYDLLNEPWVGDHMADPSLLIPGFADRINMEALWNRANTAIRSVDNTTIVYFEGATFDILSGFVKVPGGDGSKTAHSWHYYNPPQLGSFETTMKFRMEDKARLRCGSFCTEFGIWFEDNTIDKAIEAVEVMDRYLESWHGWAYENLWNFSEVHLQLALIYARTYAEATAGRALSFNFQDTTAKYKVSWLADTSITAPSLIRVSSKYYYPDGFRVFVTPERSCTVTTDDGNVLKLRYTSQAVNGTEIQANVIPFYPTDVIKNPASGKCLQAPLGKISKNQPITLRPCTSEWNQVFKFKDGAIMLAWDQGHRHDKFCLDLEGDLSANSSQQRVVLNPCQQAKLSQRWTVTSTTTSRVINKATNKCIDVSRACFLDGEPVLTKACDADNNNNQANQLWTLPRGAGGKW